MSEPSQLGQQYILFTGPLVVGLILDWCLQGTLIVQLYLYYNTNRKDRTALKLVVYGVFLLDVIQTMFATSHTWNMVVVNWGNPAVIAHPYWAGGVLPMLGGLVSGIVQSFFAWRIYALMPNRVVLGVSCFIVAVASVQSISSIVVSVLFLTDPLNLDRVFVSFYLWHSGTLVADLTITVSMVAVLWSVRSSTHFETTDRMIMRLIVLTIEVGAVTTIVAAAELAITKSYPNVFLYEVPAYILCKLSNSSLLVSLNARGYIRGGARGLDRTSVSTGQDAIKFRTLERSQLSATQDSGQSDIRTTTEIAHIDYKVDQASV